MKKLLFIFLLTMTPLFSIAKAEQPNQALTAAYHSSQSKGTGTLFPTDIYVYNYLLNPYDFVIVSTPEAPLSDAKIHPYPTYPYIQHIWNTNYAVHMRIRLFDRFGYVFFDARVDPHAIINITPAMSKEGKPVVNIT